MASTQKLETVTSFKYLDSVIIDVGSKPGIFSRIAQTTDSTDKVETSLEWQEYFSQFRDRTDALLFYIHPPQKNTSHGNQVLPQYTTHLMQRLCYQRRNPCKIQRANEPHENLLTILKRRKLQWYGYVCYSSDLAKTILQGTVNGGRRQGRQRKRWDDNIREWTGPEFAKSQRAVKNTEKNGENWVWNHLWRPNNSRG